VVYSKYVTWRSAWMICTSVRSSPAVTSAHDGLLRSWL